MIKLKKIIKRSVCLVACLILVASISFGATPASAAGFDDSTNERTEIYRGDLNHIMHMGSLANFPAPELFVYYPVDFCIYVTDVPLVFSSYFTFSLQADGVSIGSFVGADIFGTSAMVVFSSLLFQPSFDDDSAGVLQLFSFDLEGPLNFDSETRIEVVAYAPLSTSAPSEPSPTLPTGLYGNVHNLLQQHIYGDAELSADMSLTLTILSTLACLFVVALPFLLVWIVLRRLFGG